MLKSLQDTVRLMLANACFLLCVAIPVLSRMLYIEIKDTPLMSGTGEPCYLLSTVMAFLFVLFWGFAFLPGWENSEKK